jgi:hypothetical protein
LEGLRVLSMGADTWIGGNGIWRKAQRVFGIATGRKTAHRSRVKGKTTMEVDTEI